MKQSSTYNKVWKKIKKLQAVSWSPANIFYDVLGTLLAKKPFAKKIIAKIGEDGVNAELANRGFKPVALDNLVVEDFYAQNGSADCEQKLKQFGVCTIKNFVDRQIALAAAEELKQLLASNDFIDEQGRVKAPDSQETFADKGAYQWQVDLAQYNNYQAIVNAGKPVINIRSQKPDEPDSGMVDIFVIEELAEKFEMKNILACIKAAREQKMHQFLRKISGYGVRQSNLYYNAGIINTRGPHIDNNSEQYKIFIYLTDVLNEDDGPYSYVPGSHKKRSWMSKERVISAAKGYPSTEVSSFPRENATRLLAPAGTAIISCQSGIHFGWKQTEEGRRVVLIGNYN